MHKPAPTDHEVNALVRERWSPRAFSDRPIDEETLSSLLEAARWSPSSRNSQPWRFLIARREDRDAFRSMLDCLAPANQRWARNAAVLMVAVALETDHKNRPLTHGVYDTGQAVAWMTVEATSRGLRVHQMGGFDPAAVRETWAVPDEARPITAIALGFPGDPDSLEEDLRAQEIAPRKRRPATELAHFGRWGRTRK